MQEYTLGYHTARPKVCSEPTVISYPKVPDYTAIYKRVNRLDIKVDPQVGNDVTIAVDSTGIKVANRGEWMRDKWKRRRGFLKMHVGVDVISNKIVSLKVTDERS